MSNSNRDVKVVFGKYTSSHPWADYDWRLSDVLPDNAKIDQHPSVLKPEQGGTLIEILTCLLPLELYKKCCSGYYSNLIAAQPKIFVGSRLTSEKLQPFAVTVDISEAESWMETEDDVQSVALVQELNEWLERFVVENHQPEKPRKRKRRKWHNSQSNDEEDPQ